MRRHNPFAMIFAVLLAATIPAAAQTALPTHKPATTPSHSAAHTGHSKRHTREPRGQSAPARDRVTEIQTALARENAYQGDPTGNWDAATIDAMKHFQTAQNLPPTGKIDALTLQRLGLGSDVAGKGAPTPPATPPATPSASIQSDNDTQ